VKKSRIIIITVIITLVVISGATIALKAGKNKSNEGTVVRIEKAKRGELIEFVSAPGEIEPKTKVEISAKVSARIIELPFEEGDTVTCGDPEPESPIPASVLVRLDSKDLESQLVSAEAGRAAQAAQTQVEKARIAGQRASLVGIAASVAQAQRDLQRQRGLLESQDISQATFDQARLKFDEFQSQYGAAKYTLESAELNLIVLQHNLEAADARIAQAREALSHTIISSPIDGVVTRLNAEVGEMVMTGTMNNPGTVIIEVADLSTMLLVAQVDEADVGKLEVGQKGRVHVQAWPDKIFDGEVRTVALSHKFSNQGTKYYEAEVLLINPDEQVFTGMTADVDIAVAEHGEILIVPSQAVLGRKVDELPVKIRDKLTEQERKKAFASVVYVYKDGKAVATPVKIGASNTTQTVIMSGLTVEDKIVVGPYKELEKLKHEQIIQDEREVEAEKDAKAKTDANEPNDVNAVSDTNDAPGKE